MTKTRKILGIVLAVMILALAMSISVFATTVTTETDLADAFKAGGEVTLGGNVEVTAEIQIPAGVTATLDLAGYEITSGYQTDSTTKHIYPLNNYGTLTIKDSKGTGSITGRGIYVQNGSKLTLESGSIYGIDSNGGSALYQYGGAIVINGGLVEQTADYTYNYAVYAGGGTVDVYGGKIVGKHGAISVSGADVTLYGGELVCTGNEGWTDNVVYVTAGSFTAKGGSVTHEGATANADSGAAVVAASSDATITIEDGTFVGLNGSISGNANTTISGGEFDTAWDKDEWDNVTSYVTTGAVVTIAGETVVKNEDGTITTKEQPKGTITYAYVKEVDGYVRVWGEANCNAYESFVIKLYSGEILVATTQLNNVGDIIDGSVYVTWNFFYPESNDEYWTTTWEEGHPNTKEIPDKIVLYVDGTEVASNTVKMSGADDLNPVKWRELGGVIVADLEGAGTEEDPYLISNLEELKWFRDDVNAGNNYAGKYVKVTAGEIDLASTEWEPIGYNGKTFKGSFNGNGVVIKNLVITKTLDNSAENNGIGFFGRTDSPAVIENITIENVDITGSLYVGAIVGRGYTGDKIENCTVKGNITIDAWWYAGVIGGNGYMNLVNNCCVIGNDGSYIKGNNGSYIGGIWGFRGEGSNKITNCTVTNLEITGVDRVGGISGMAHYGNEISGVAVNDVSVTATDSEATTVGLIAGACQGNEESPSVIKEATVESVKVTIGETDVTETVGVYGTNINGSTPVTNYVAEVNGVKYENLADAIEAAKNGGTIELLNNITLTSNIKIEDGMDITINGNGKTITGASGKDVFYVKGGKLTLGEGLNVYAPTDCCIYILGGEVITSANLTKGGVKYSVIQGNGNYAGNVTINGGKIVNEIAEKVAIYWPQNGKLTINGGEIIGGTAVRINSGSLEITGGKLVANGAKNDYVASNGGSVADTGDALMIENIGGTSGYEAITSVSITGGTFESAKANAVASYTAGNEGVNAVTGFISGGTFSSAVAAELCVLGYAPVANEDGTFGVKVVAVVSVTDAEGNVTYFDDLHEGLMYAHSLKNYGTVINLLADVDLKGSASNAWASVGGRSNLLYGSFNGNGHTISNLYVKSISDGGSGLFGGLAGSISNLTIHNATITDGGHRVGAFVGQYSGNNASNLKLTGLVQITGKTMVGAVFGEMGSASLTNIVVNVDSGSYVKSTDDSRDAAHAGGVVARVEGTIDMSSVSCNINVESELGYVGGVIGYLKSSSTISDVTYTGNVTSAAAANDGVGAILGAWNNSSDSTVVAITNSTSTGTVTADGEAETSLVGNATEPSTGNGSVTIDGEEAWPLACAIGDVHYTSLDEALKAAKSGDTIILFEDAKQFIPTPNGVTIDTNGFNLDITAVAKAYVSFGGVNTYFLTLEEAVDFANKNNLAKGYSAGQSTIVVLEDVEITETLYLFGCNILKSNVPYGGKYPTITYKGSNAAIVTFGTSTFKNIVIDVSEASAGTFAIKSYEDYDEVKAMITEGKYKDYYQYLDTEKLIKNEIFGNHAHNTTLGGVTINAGNNNGIFAGDVHDNKQTRYVALTLQGITCNASTDLVVNAVVKIENGASLNINNKAFNDINVLKGTLKLMSNLSDVKITLGDGATLDGNGKTISGNSTVYMSKTGTSTVKNLTFKDIHNDASTLSAIYATSLETGAKAVITGCTFENIDWDAIQLTSLNDNRVAAEITNNVFKADTDDAVVQMRHLHIELGTSTRSGIDLTLTGNKFYGTQEVGIWYVDPANTTFNIDKNYVENINHISIAYNTAEKGTYNANEEILPLYDEALENELVFEAMVVAGKYDAMFYATLQEAIAAAEAGNTVKLLDNITVSEQIKITDNGVLSDITFDGNGYTITANLNKENQSVLYFGDTATSAWATGVTIKNVTIDGTARFAIALMGGTSSVLENVTVTGDYLYGINFYGTHGATLTNCNIVTAFTNGQDDYPLNLVDNTTIGHLYANKSDVADSAKIFIDETSTVTELTFWGESTIMIDPASYDRIGKVNATLVAENNGVYYTTLQAAFEAAADGATVTLLENVELTETIKITGTVTFDLNGKQLIGPDVPATSSYYAFIVDGGNLTLKDSVGGGEIWAKCYGIETKSGTFTMESGTITATNNKTLGSAIVNYGGTVTINGGTLAGALSAVYAGGYFSDASTSILGGTINGVVVVEDWADKDFTETISSTDNTYDVEDDYKWVLENGVYVLTAKVYVAQVGDNKYEALADAIAAAVDGDTVTLLADVTIDQAIKIYYNVTIDLNGKTVTSTVKDAFGIYANSTIKNGKIIGANRCVNIRETVEFTLDSVTLVADNYTSEFSNPQALTIGGNGNGTAVTMNNVTISAKAGYGIISFVKTNLTATNCTIGGYNALYVKAGSEGSEFTFVNCALSSDIGTNDVASNSFAAIVLETNNITVNVDADSSITATGSHMYAIAVGTTIADVTGNTVTVAGTISGNIISTDDFDNTVAVKAEYADELAAAGYATSEADENGLVTVEKPDIEWYQASLSLENNMKMNFYLYTSSIVDGVQYYARVIKHHDEGCHEHAECEIHYIPVELWTKGDTYTRIVVDGIAAKDMACVVEIQIFIGETPEDTTVPAGTNPSAPEGAIEASILGKMSIRSYCELMFERTDAEAEAVKPLLADLLNYGASAQKYFGHYIEGEDGNPVYVTTGIEEIISQYATEKVDVENESQWISGNPMFFNSFTLSLEDTTHLNFYFKNLDTASLAEVLGISEEEVDITKITANVSFTHHSGKPHSMTYYLVDESAEVVDESIHTISYDQGYAAISIDDLAPADLFKEVTVTLSYDSEVLASFSTSATSYCAYVYANKDTNEEYTDELIAVCDAIIALAEQARTYFPENTYVSEESN